MFRPIFTEKAVDIIGIALDISTFIENNISMDIHVKRRIEAKIRRPHPNPPSARRKAWSNPGIADEVIEALGIDGEHFK